MRSLVTSHASPGDSFDWPDLVNGHYRCCLLWPIIKYAFHWLRVGLRWATSWTNYTSWLNLLSGILLRTLQSLSKHVKIPIWKVINQLNTWSKCFFVHFLSKNAQNFITKWQFSQIVLEFGSTLDAQFEGNFVWSTHIPLDKLCLIYWFHH